MSETGKIIEEEGCEAFHRYYGTYRGFVHSNEDPKNLGRLQLVVPKVYEDEPFEEWAPPRGIYSGKDAGSFWIPSEGDQVWVTFEGGDVGFPIWEYGPWRTGEVPVDAKPKVKVLQTGAGRLMFDEEKGTVELKHKDGYVMSFDKDGVSIDAQGKEMFLYAGDNKVELTDSGINVETNKKISLNGGMEVLYNKIPGQAITDISQIGSSDKVTVG